MDATPIVDETNNDAEENQRHSRSPNIQQSSIDHHEDRGSNKRASRASLGMPGTFSVIYEVPTNADDTGITFAPPPAARSSNFIQQQERRRSTGTGPFERQLSILDPMSDRVSTILAWKNLVVFTRDESRKNKIKRLMGKAPETKSKHLLHNLSGAITGGLWAVMGKLIHLISSKYRFDIICIYRSIRFRQINSSEYISMSFGCEHFI